jgi:hypothetical protein
LAVMDVNLAESQSDFVQMEVEWCQYRRDVWVQER